MTWDVAFRKRTADSILSDMESPFIVMKTQDGTWAADPFLFDYKDDTYIFYELFLEKKNKGVIACGRIVGDSVVDQRIVLEESIHLSFPCIFKIENDIYMIPETGSKHALYLYKCTSFPQKWTLVKVLKENIDSSDSIFINYKNEYYLLASVISGSPSEATNHLFRFDETTFELSDVYDKNEFSECGIRNAGMIFSDHSNLYRPGQNCPNKDYGKSLIMWQVHTISNHCYEESKFKEISISDVKIKDDQTHNGIHTYNLSSRYEVIDLRKISKTPFLRRLNLFAFVFINRIKSDLR